MIRTLPKEVSIRIISFLNGQDIANISQTCHYFHDILSDDYSWRELLAQRLSRERRNELQENTSSNFKDKYIRLTRSKNYASDPRLVELAWGNDTRYWRHVQSNTSVYGQVAQLNWVCWLDVITIINIPNGKYMPVWRLKFSSEFSSPLNFLVSTDLENSSPPADEAIRATLPVSLLRTINDSTYLKLYIPTPLTVNSAAGFCDVKLRMWNTDGIWKSGLEIDFIELVPQEKMKTSFEIEENAKELEAKGERYNDVVQRTSNADEHRSGIFQALQRLNPFVSSSSSSATNMTSTSSLNPERMIPLQL